MTCLRLLAASGLIVGAFFSVSLAAPEEPRFGDTRFLAYEGEQTWPTADNAMIIKDHAVPVYVGLPNKPYRILGRIYDDRRSGFARVGRAFAEGLFPEKDRQRDVANQAKHRGGDAVLVTDDATILKALNLDAKELRETTPLFDHKDKVTLAIKFQ
jgi:hypothetical protein